MRPTRSSGPCDGDSGSRPDLAMACLATIPLPAKGLTSPEVEMDLAAACPVVLVINCGVPRLAWHDHEP